MVKENKIINQESELISFIKDLSPIRYSIKKFIDKWDKGSLGELESPQQFNKYKKAIIISQWCGRCIAAGGGVLSLIGYPEIGGSIGVICPFVEFLVSHYKEKKMEKKEKWEEFTKDAENIWDTYLELGKIVKFNRPSSFSSDKAEEVFESLKGITWKKEVKKLSFCSNNSDIMSFDSGDDSSDDNDKINRSDRICCCISTTKKREAVEVVEIEVKRDEFSFYLQSNWKLAKAELEEIRKIIKQLSSCCQELISHDKEAVVEKDKKICDMKVDTGVEIHQVIDLDECFEQQESQSQIQIPPKKD